MHSKGYTPEMSFAEIVLRIGGAIGGWLTFIAYALTLGVLGRADCDPNSQELWRGTLFFGFLTALALLLVGRGLQWRRALRWLASIAAALGVYAGLVILPAIGAVTLGGDSLCGVTRAGGDAFSGFVATPLERLWPLVQFAILALGLVQAARYWRADSDSR